MKQFKDLTIESKIYYYELNELNHNEDYINLLQYRRNPLKSMGIQVGHLITFVVQKSKSNYVTNNYHIFTTEKECKEYLMKDRESKINELKGKWK